MFNNSAAEVCDKAEISAFLLGLPFGIVASFAATRPTGFDLVVVLLPTSAGKLRLNRAGKIRTPRPIVVMFAFVSAAGDGDHRSDRAI